MAVISPDKSEEGYFYANSLYYIKISNFRDMEDTLKLIRDQQVVGLIPILGS